MELGGKSAFVTGGSGDIGGAIARGLAKAGVDVAVSYVGDARRASATVDAVHKFGQRSVAIRLDQRDSNLIDASVGEVLAGLAMITFAYARDPPDPLPVGGGLTNDSYTLNSALRWAEGPYQRCRLKCR